MTAGGVAHIDALSADEQRLETTVLDQHHAYREYQQAAKADPGASGSVFDLGFHCGIDGDTQAESRNDRRWRSHDVPIRAGSCWTTGFPHPTAISSLIFLNIGPTGTAASAQSLLCPLAP